MRTSRYLAALVSATLLAFGAASIPRASASSTSAPPWLGVYRGAGAASLIPAYESWLGAPAGSVSYVTDNNYLAGKTDWTNVDNATWTLGQWKGSGRNLVLGVAMLPAGGAYTLEQGATGAYNSHFVTLAQQMVANGFGDAVVRLGWEFNATWYPWAARGHEAAFAAYWRQIVTAMRSVPGAANLKFDFCAAIPTPGGWLSANIEAAYPGDAYVNYIGLDAYDGSTVSASSNPAGRWNDLMNRPYGLAWQKAFAAAHGKQMSYGEWGLWQLPATPQYNSGDDSYYIQHMYDWFNSNNVAFANYFEINVLAADKSVAEYHALAYAGTQFPKSAALYQQLFSHASDQSTTAPTTTAPVTTTTTAPVTTTTAAPVTPSTGAPLNPGVPSAPTGLTAKAAGNKVVVAWNGGSANGQRVDGNNAYRNGEKVAWLGYPYPPTTTWTDGGQHGNINAAPGAGLAPGTYRYQLSSYNSKGESALSAPITVVVAAAGSPTTVAPTSMPPATPTGLKVTVTGRTVVLSWSAGSTNNQRVDGDNIFRNGQQVAWLGYPYPPTTTWTDSGQQGNINAAPGPGLAPGTYRYQVAAYNSAGQGTLSAPITVVVSAR